MNATADVLREHCDVALTVLGRVCGEQPSEMTEDLPEAVRSLVRLRDSLIEQHRANHGSREVKERLDRTNAILSVVTGGEYPMIGVRRERIKEARDALAKLAQSF